MHVRLPHKDRDGDDPAVTEQIERQKMLVEMEHLNTRMKSLLRDQEKMTNEKGELNTKMDLELKKHEHIYNYLNRQIEEKDNEIEALQKAKAVLSGADYSLVQTSVHRHLRKALSL